MKKYRSFTTVFILILLWQIFASRTDNDFLMPYPLDVLQYMLSLLSTQSFYVAVATTLLRVFIGLTIAFTMAMLCATLAYRHRVFHDLFYPILLLTRSIPNISYVIIILLWFGAEKSSAIITFLILFPMMYANLYEGLGNINRDLLNVMKIYPEKKSYLIRKIYIPLLHSSIKASLLTGISFGFKVGVMAEIVAQAQNGIGRQMNYCKVSFDMTGVFAWTGWIILLALIMEIFIHLILYRKKEVH